jgi:hypothetical protein
LRDDAERVAGFVAEGGAGVGEVELDVVDLLGGAGGVQVADGEDGGQKRIILRVTRFRGGGAES